MSMIGTKNQLNLSFYETWISFEFCLKNQQTYLAHNLFDELNRQRLNEIRTKQKQMYAYIHILLMNMKNKREMNKQTIIELF